MSLRQRALPDVLARRLLDEAGIDLSVSTRYPLGLLATVASSLDVRTEFDSHLTVDGQTCRGREGITVRLARSSHDTRTVFTFAHELAHIALRKYASEIPNAADLTPRQTERLCDAVAAATVLPRAWVNASIDGQPSIAEVFAMAHSANVSPTAVVLRLRDMGFDFCFVRLRTLNDGRWIAASAVGLPHEVRRLLAPDDVMSRRLDDATDDACDSRRGPALRKLQVSLHYERERTRDTPATIHATAETAHLLIDRLRCTAETMSSSSAWTLHLRDSGSRSALHVPSHAPGQSPPIWIRTTAD